MSEVPEGFSLRPISINDFSKGFLELLGQLTTVGSVSQDDFKSNF